MSGWLVFHPDSGLYAGKAQWLGNEAWVQEPERAQPWRDRIGASAAMYDLGVSASARTVRAKGYSDEQAQA
ncbi:hypothetical protein CKO33_02290 [Ectothiorhodospira mobilis]|nr:hypothetical protein [Ectothiorhodospira mobilis]